MPVTVGMTDGDDCCCWGCGECYDDDDDGAGVDWTGVANGAGWSNGLDTGFGGLARLFG